MTFGASWWESVRNNQKQVRRKRNKHHHNLRNILNCDADILLKCSNNNQHPQQIQDSCESACKTLQRKLLCRADWFSHAIICLLSFFYYKPRSGPPRQKHKSKPCSCICCQNSVNTVFTVTVERWIRLLQWFHFITTLTENSKSLRGISQAHTGWASSAEGFYIPDEDASRFHVALNLLSQRNRARCPEWIQVGSVYWAEPP